MDKKKPKSFYSIFDYISVTLYFNKIEPTKHYLEKHEDDVPWNKVLEIVLNTKNPKKKENKYKIKKQGYYILFEIKNKILYIINAKKPK